MAIPLQRASAAEYLGMTQTTHGLAINKPLERIQNARKRLISIRTAGPYSKGINPQLCCDAVPYAYREEYLVSLTPNHPQVGGVVRALESAFFKQTLGPTIRLQHVRLRALFRIDSMELRKRILAVKLCTRLQRQLVRWST